MSARDQAQERADYSLGSVVGECLLHKCQIFTGWLETDSPKSGDPVTIRVQQPLFGPLIQANTIEVPYSSEIVVKAPYTGPAWAWRGVPLVKSRLLAFVLTLEQRGGHDAGEPLFISSESKATDTIAALIKEDQWLRSSPDSIADDVASLSSKKDPAAAGLLFTRLADRDLLFRPDFGAPLMLQLLGNQSVPSDVWRMIKGEVVVSYYGLSDDRKAAIVSGFRRLIQSPDPHAALAAFEGLWDISQFDSSARVSEGDLIRLRGTYLDLLKDKSEYRQQQVEAKLGIQLQ
jgi:hypothetical protein